MFLFWGPSLSVVVSSEKQFKHLSQEGSGFTYDYNHEFNINPSGYMDFLNRLAEQNNGVIDCSGLIKESALAVNLIDELDKTRKKIQKNLELLSKD